MAKYEPLADYLRALPNEETDVRLSFARLDALVGGLPASAHRHRPWWANNSQVQSLAWQQAGWHTEKVDLAAREVRFARGAVGGAYAARGRVPASGGSSAPAAERRPAADLPVVGRIELAVSLEWRRLGEVLIDDESELAFPSPIPAGAGLYRLSLHSSARGRAYIGESDNLKRRLATNYRNPGPTQTTSLRINQVLFDHLTGGGRVDVDIATRAELRTSGDGLRGLDLASKPGRLLAENAALVLARLDDEVDLLNLG